MFAKVFYEFTYARLITNIFLIFVLVGKNFLAPFFVIYLKYLRLSALEAGIICAGQALSEMIFGPFWLFAVRRSRDCNKKRALIIISLVMTSAIYTCFVFIPPNGTPDDVTHCIPSQEQQQTSFTVIPAKVLPSNLSMSTVLPRKISMSSASFVQPTTSTILTSSIPPEVFTTKVPTILSTTQAYLMTEAPIEPQLPQIYRESGDDGEYPQYGEPVEENNNEELISTKRKPPPQVPAWNTWDREDVPSYYDDPWNSRKLQSISISFEEASTWLSTPVFKATFILSFIAAAVGCVAEPTVSSLWAQRLDDAEHLEQRGEHIVWARFITSITLTLLAILLSFLSDCFVGRGLHQTVIHPLGAASTLAGAAVLALILLPLPTGKLPAAPGPPRARSVTQVSGIRRVARGIATLLCGAATTSGSLYLLWHVSTLPPQGFKHNYELLYGGFAALEALCAVPVLGWSRSPSTGNSASPGRAALGLMVLALQFSLAPLLHAPAPLPLLGVLQGSGGALLERSLGRAHASSSWRLGSAIGAIASGLGMHVVGARCTMWAAAVLALVAALAVLITGRSPPTRRRRRAYSRLLLAEAPGPDANSTPRDDPNVISDSEDGESDWLERALRDEDCNGAHIS